MANLRTVVRSPCSSIRATTLPRQSPRQWLLIACLGLEFRHWVLEMRHLGIWQKCTFLRTDLFWPKRKVLPLTQIKPSESRIRARRPFSVHPRSICVICLASWKKVVFAGELGGFPDTDPSNFDFLPWSDLASRFPL